MGPIHHRYSVLLGLILVSLVFQMAVPDSDNAQLASVLLQAVTLIVAVVTSQAHRWVIRLTIGACIVLVF
ncbi:MAG: hypothetical protein M3M99_06030, partial [Actinomycetota bacterium]|nr:hypothetical protein [Actinomycetota bacterium]